MTLDSSVRLLKLNISLVQYYDFTVVLLGLHEKQESILSNPELFG